MKPDWFLVFCLFVGILWIVLGLRECAVNVRDSKFQTILGVCMMVGGGWVVTISLTFLF